MHKPIIYLAGPIGGLTYGQATDWRDNVQMSLVDNGFHPISPMRAKSFLNNGQTLDNNDIHDSVLVSDQAIMARDSWDVHRCDAVLADLTGAKSVSIGTVMELAWAWKAGIPAVVVMEKDNIHKHIMLQQSTPYYCETIDDGVELLLSLFG